MSERAEAVNKIMFEYETLSQDELLELLSGLSLKLIRWMAIHHPDNRTRKFLFRQTNIAIGQDTVVNTNFVVSDGYERLVTIGERVAIAPNVTIIAQSNPNNSKLAENPFVSDNLMKEEKVVIEDDVWIGTNVTILPGVTIGAGSVIGAGSMVNKDIPPHSLATGVPCRAIKSLAIDDGEDRRDESP